MDIAHWHEYKAAEGKAKRKILDRILADNEKFIVANVHRLMRRGLVSPMSSIAASPTEDLIQAGRVGYMRALEKFDPTKGAFPTYAQHWIRHEVQQAALVETTIRKPKDSGLPYAALKKMDVIRTRFGRAATGEELGVTEEALVRWRTEPFVTPYEEHYTTGGSVAREFDNGNSEDGGTAAAEQWLEDHEGTDPEQLLGLKDLHRLVDKLAPLEKAVISAMYFSDRSVEQVVHDLKISCSTLYEVRDSALAKLRADI